MSDRLTLEQLEIFVRTAEAPSFRAAAEQMGITEPKLSGHIRALEQCLEVKLFERQRGIRARVTAFGRELLPFAKNILQEVAKLHEFVYHGESKENVAVPITCYPAHVERFLGSVIKEFIQDHPHVRIDLRVRNDRRRNIGPSLFEELQAGGVDLVFGPPQRHLGFNGIKAYEAKIRVLLPNDHELRHAGQVSLELLKEISVLIAPKNHYSRQKVESACWDAGFRLRVAGESASPPALCVLGNAGVGVPILPDDYSLVSASNREYPVLLDVDGNELSTAVWLHWRREDHPPAVAAFIECAKKWADLDLRTSRIAALPYGEDQE